jgi:hypothetical protein
MCDFFNFTCLRYLYKINSLTEIQNSSSEGYRHTVYVRLFHVVTFWDERNLQISHGHVDVLYDRQSMPQG